MSRNRFHAVQTAAAFTPTVLVAFSGGKDSVVVLDLCVKHFKRVEAVFMYAIKGLSFQEAMLTHYEQRYGITIHRIPHFMLSEMFRYGLYRVEDYNVPVVGITDVHDYARCLTDTYWLATGERMQDSLERRAQIHHAGSINQKRGLLYPVAEWSTGEVLAYIKQHKLHISPEYRYLGQSFGHMDQERMSIIKVRYPEDYARICRWFPLADGAVKHREFYATA